MDLNLADKVILITGGTEGLGAGLAEFLVAEGARVTVCGRDAARLENMQARLGDSGLAVQADVTSAEDSSGLMDRTIRHWGRLDGLVNNAARSMAGPFEAFNEDDWRDDLELKLIAAVRLIRLALPHLRVSSAAAIVNVLNIGAKNPKANSLPTTATRAAGLAMTKALAAEFARDGIRLNAIMVGLIESGQWVRRADETGVTLEQFYASQAQGIPLGRVGTPSDFAALASFLLSPRAAFITGSAVNLDGGASASW